MSEPRTAAGRTRWTFTGPVVIEPDPQSGAFHVRYAIEQEAAAIDVERLTRATKAERAVAALLDENDRLREALRSIRDSRETDLVVYAKNCGATASAALDRAALESSAA